MTFQCHQPWESMSTTERGRLCHKCSKEVVDFRNMSVEEIQKYRTADGEKPCGVFNLRQVYPDIIARVAMPGKFRFITCLSAIVVSLLTKQASAQPAHEAQSIQVERSVNPAYPASVISPEVSSPMLRIPDATPATQTQPFLKTKRRQYFLTKKFPFIICIRNKPTSFIRFTGRYL